MKNDDLKSMSVDELWNLHERVVAELNHKIASERATLDRRLRELGSVVENGMSNRARRPYPKVMPKYRNPRNQNETWAGRGKTPRWLRAQLSSGKKLNDFLIAKKRA
jgi:DNA-binding protein H-NS